MSLPIKRSDYDEEWHFHSAVYDLIFKKAKRLSGEKWDLDAWERVLRPLEFDFVLLEHFDGVWNNNGHFIDTVKCCEFEFARIDRALRRMGFNVAASLMPRALELDALQTPYLRKDIRLPRDLAKEIKRVNKTASDDVSEERPTRVITERAAEFDVRASDKPRRKSLGSGKGSKRNS